MDRDVVDSVRVLLCACAAAALVSAQVQYDFGPGQTNFGSAYFAPAVFNQLAGAAGGRDARANTGPVVFPPSPPGDPSQTSGVVVGASGYGFVPPSSQGSGFPRFFYQQFYFR